MRKLLFYVLFIIIGVGIFLFGPILSNFLVWVHTPISSVGDYPSWISFFGSYIGAIIGGATAYFVARVQAKGAADALNAQFEEEKKRRFVSQVQGLVAARIELGKIKEGFNDIDFYLSVREFNDDGDHIENAKRLTTAILFIKPLNDRNCNTFYSINDSKLLIRLLELSEFYNEFQNGLTIETPSFDEKSDKDLVNNGDGKIAISRSTKFELWSKYLTFPWVGEVNALKTQVEALLNDITSLM